MKWQNKTFKLRYCIGTNVFIDVAGRDREPEIERGEIARPAREPRWRAEMERAEIESRDSYETRRDEIVTR